MASVDKIRIGSTTYDVSPSGSGTLKDTEYSSGDSASATSWTNVEAITTTNTQSQIFTKVTTMVKNIRYLYAKLGTTDFSSAGTTVSGALKNLQDNKAPATHSHTTANLPVSNTQVNSDAYIPTSSLVYSMNSTLTSLNDASKFTTGFTTNITCGGIASGTTINAGDTLQSTVKSMIWRGVPPEPSTEYESVSLGTWASASDVDTFFTQHTPANGFAGIKLGNYVTINDGTYNAVWEVAGFNLEHNQTAADGTTYDNGYGILMIPKTQITTATWNANNTLTGAYASSTMHTSHLVTAANNMRNILGSHMIQRNVLLSNSYDSDGSHPYYDTGYSGASNNYTWTTSYLTLMSIGQMNGTDFGKRHNKYDDGEANYKLPVFNFENYYTGSSFWSRCVWGYYDGYCLAWRVYSDGGVDGDVVGNTYGVRPLMLLR